MLRKNIEPMSSNHTIAIFIDFENLALGYKGQGRFEIQLVLKRLLEKGKIVAKKAYCDWSRFSHYTAPLHEAAIELIEIPKRGQTGKNSADIRLCVDAMDLAYSKDHIDTFVVVSGDSDFSPLVSKLKELGKHVIGLGMSESTSSLLRDNCDEFIYYEDLTQSVSAISPSMPGDVTENKQKAFNYLFEGLQALRRENREVLGSSLVKDTIRRMHPSFNENHLGFKNWGSLLVDAQRQGLLELTTDPKSGTFVVVRFGDEMKGHSPAPLPPRNSRSRSGQGRRPTPTPTQIQTQPQSQPEAHTQPDSLVVARTSETSDIQVSAAQLPASAAPVERGTEQLSAPPSVVTEQSVTAPLPPVAPARTPARRRAPRRPSDKKPTT